jgi:hypothetical protein
VEIAKKLLMCIIGFGDLEIIFQIQSPQSEPIFILMTSYEVINLIKCRQGYPSLWFDLQLVWGLITIDTTTLNNHF